MFLARLKKLREVTRCGIKAWIVDSLICYSFFQAREYNNNNNNNNNNNDNNNYNYNNNNCYNNDLITVFPLEGGYIKDNNSNNNIDKKL